MIFVEKTLESLNLEIRALTRIDAGPNMSLVRQGAILALIWVKDGGKLPSEAIADRSAIFPD